MNLPSLYFSLASYALSYFQPTVSLHCLQWMSRTMWRPVVMLRSLGSDSVTLTTTSKRYALPCWPRKFWVCQCVLQVSLGEFTDSANYVIVVGQVSLAVLASVYLGRVQVDVVREPHVG
jgi:hypothetical protein